MHQYLKYLFALLSACFVGFVSNAQNDLQWFQKYVQQNKETILQQYIDFVNIPNVVSQKNAFAYNADYLVQFMQRAGIQNTLLLFRDNTKPPVVYGELMVPNATQTIVFYAHYDGQPADSSGWYKGLNPFKPSFFTNAINNGGKELTKEEWLKQLNDNFRIYARGAADDKAGVMAILQAFIALKKQNLLPTVNVKFFFEGEEEAGSPNLAKILAHYKSLLQSDVWIICDGPQPANGKNLLSFGVRGDTHMDITLYGSKTPLHSGHYGNWAPNPAWNMVHLLASMKNDSGLVTIPNFYSDVQPISNAEKKVWDQIQQNDALLKEQFGFSGNEMNGISLINAIQLPTLNINGIASGHVGNLSTNSIPATASVSIDLRLVPGNDYLKQQQKVIQHITSKGYYVISHEPTDEERMKYPLIAKVETGSGYNAQKTPIDWPMSQQIIKAVNEVSPNGLIIMPLTGGSLPLIIIEQQLGAKAISLPIANYDDNQHAANENIRIGNFWNGIKEILSIMTMKNGQ